jgi:hypothetical protein
MYHTLLNETLLHAKNIKTTSLRFTKHTTRRVLPNCVFWLATLQAAHDSRRMASYALPLRAALSLLPSQPTPPLRTPRHTAVFSLSIAEPWNWIPRLLCIWEKGRQQERLEGNFHLHLAGSTFTTLPHVILKDFFLHLQAVNISWGSHAWKRLVWTRHSMW